MTYGNFQLIIFFALFTGTLSVQWPNNIRRCYLNDLKFNKCLLSTAKATIPLLTRGVKLWGMVPVDPYKMLSDMTINNDNPPLNLTFHVTNGIVTDATKVELQKIKYDKRKRQFNLEAYHNVLKMNGNYHLTGTVFNLNLSSKGKFGIEFRKSNSTYKINLITAKSGEPGFVDFKSYYRMKNLRGMTAWFRDPDLNPAISTILHGLVNENWKVIYNMLQTDTEKGFSDQFDLTFAPMFRKFSLDEILPPEPPEAEKTAETETEPTSSRLKKSENVL